MLGARPLAYLAGAIALALACAPPVEPAPPELAGESASEPVVADPVDPPEESKPERESEPPAEPEPEPEPAIDIPKVSDKFVKRILDQQERVQSYAAKHEIDPDLVNAVIWVESKFDPKAKGPAGAMGLMQLMPRTAGSLAKRLGRRSRPYDPDFNLDAGCLYIKRILKRFDGDLPLSLAAYNRGVGRVKGWVEAGEAIPERTAAYVDRVLAAKAWLPHLIAREATPATRVEADALATWVVPKNRAILAP